MGLFNKGKKNEDAAAKPELRLSKEPIQSLEDQAKVHDKMEAELAASRAAREAKNTAAAGN